MTAENPEFDHLLHWVPDVEKAVEAYCSAGLPAHTNEALDGFQNGGWRLDERYVEILTITDPEALRSSRYAAALDLLRPAIAAAGEGGAITFAVNVTDARATAERLRRQGHQVAEFAVSVDEHPVSFVEIFVQDGPAWLPFFITYSPPRDVLLAGADPGAFERGPHDLTGIVIETAEPERWAGFLADLLDLPADGTRIALPGAEVVFELGPREAIIAMTLSGDRPDGEIQGLGLRFG